MRIAYFDCFAGISGDMALGALLDAGADPEALVAGLRTLALPDWELRARKVAPDGIAATDVEIMVGGEPAGDATAIDLHHTHDTEEHGHHHSSTSNATHATDDHGHPQQAYGTIKGT